MVQRDHGASHLGGHTGLADGACYCTLCSDSLGVYTIREGLLFKYQRDPRAHRNAVQLAVPVAL